MTSTESAVIIQYRDNSRVGGGGVINKQSKPRSGRTTSHIGAILKEERVKAGLTQIQMGELTGVSTKALRQLEQGHEENVNFGSIKRILAYFGLTLSVIQDHSIKEYRSGIIERMDLLNRLKSIKIAIEKPFDIRRLRLFGSYARGEARDDSDVDILLTTGRNLSFSEIVRIEKIFEEVLGGKKTDIILEKEIDSDVLAAAEKDLIDV